MGSTPSVCSFVPDGGNHRICAKCLRGRDQHSRLENAYPCSLGDCKCAHFQGVTALCGKCRHGLCLHCDPVTQDTVMDPDLPVAQARRTLTQMLTSGFSQARVVVLCWCLLRRSLFEELFFILSRVVTELILPYPLLCAFVLTVFNCPSHPSGELVRPGPE